jgi:acyl-CoA synthetase (AMP-forming)/AMP-acid ligase II
MAGTLTGAASLDDFLRQRGIKTPVVNLPACPLMHGTGLLTAMSALVAGGTVVTLGSAHFDADELWDAVSVIASTRVTWATLRRRWCARGATAATWPAC